MFQLRFPLELLVVIMEPPNALSIPVKPTLEEIKKHCLTPPLPPPALKKRKEKRKLLYLIINFLALTLKYFLYFLKRKLFLYFGKRKPRMNYFISFKLLIFLEVTFQSRKMKKPNLKKFLIFRENGKIFQERPLKSEAKKISHFSKVSKTKSIHSSS